MRLEAGLAAAGAWGGIMPVRTKPPEPAADGQVLPPGQRDRSGFWFPLGYQDPSTLVRRRGSRRGASGAHPDEERRGRDQASPS